ncbi:transposase [Micromonospora yasonensis]|uniref:transposase n=1 Tax=Micromonospora yasonensis TaxID=1128667 RepID=UPI00222FF859|nr:transposase [Micromonospora yasonensis]MCW3840510.1 transposase [Micromonospora yasonensis]
MPGDGHFGSADVRCRWIPYLDDAAPKLTDALRWARSINPLLRRRAARNVELPADIIGVHADDRVAWSSGPVEGNVNRIKMLRRQMYGRANPDLLRHRIVLSD